MELTTDTWIFWQWDLVKINATIVFTWSVMGLLVIVSRLVTRNLSCGVEIGRGQVALEVIVTYIRDQIDEVAPGKARLLLPFVGTLFLFIAACNLLLIVPVYRPPTGSLSTTAALACCVFVAVPAFGIAEQGLAEYLRHYVRPNVLMLPFHVLGELSRTLALAIRLFGNVMSGTLVGAILLSIAPLIFPVALEALGLLTGLVQAYVFAVLTLIYLASAIQQHGPATRDAEPAAVASGRHPEDPTSDARGD